MARLGDSSERERKDYFVRYRTKEGRLVESSLVNPKGYMRIGEWVTIKYIPGQENHPVLV